MLKANKEKKLGFKGNIKKKNKTFFKVVLFLGLVFLR